MISGLSLIDRLGSSRQAEMLSLTVHTVNASLDDFCLIKVVVALTKKQKVQTSYTQYDPSYPVAKFQCKLNSTLIAGILSDSEVVQSLETQVACLSPPTGVLSQRLSQWVDANKTMLEHTRDVHLPALPQFASVLAEHCAIETEAMKELERDAMDVREEEMRLGGLSGAVSAYQTMSERCLQQDTLIQRKQSKIGMNTDHDTAARYLREVQAEREVLEQLQGELETTKNNLMRDGQDFSIARETHLAETLKLVVDTQKRRWSRNREFWQEKLKSLAE